MSADIDWFISKDVGSVMVDSAIQLFGRKTHVLFVTLGACYHIDEV